MFYNLNRSTAFIEKGCPDFGGGLGSPLQIRAFTNSNGIPPVTRMVPNASTVRRPS